MATVTHVAFAGTTRVVSDERAAELIAADPGWRRVDLPRVGKGDRAPGPTRRARRAKAVTEAVTPDAPDEPPAPEPDENEV